MTGKGRPLNSRATLNGAPGPGPDPREEGEKTLRRMNHEEWLRQFSQVLGITNERSPPMTPFRQGAVSRLMMAAEYVRLLRRDAEILTAGLRAAEHELAKTRDMHASAMGAIRRLKLQRDKLLMDASSTPPAGDPGDAEEGR